MTSSAQDLRPVAYADGAQKLNGLLAGHSGKGGPGVLLLPAWMGIDAEARAAAVKLAKEGYMVFIADIYGEGHVPKDATGAQQVSDRYKSDPAAYRRRIALALEQLAHAGADPARTAVAGYCFGGTGALEAARGHLPVRGAVSVHGGARKGWRAEGPIGASVLILHPAADRHVSGEDVAAVTAELDAAGADWQVISYARCGHTFTDPASPEYDERMAGRAWRHMLLFLREVLG